MHAHMCTHTYNTIKKYKVNITKLKLAWTCIWKETISTAHNIWKLLILNVERCSRGHRPGEQKSRPHGSEKLLSGKSLNQKHSLHFQMQAPGFSALPGYWDTVRGRAQICAWFQLPGQTYRWEFSKSSPEKVHFCHMDVCSWECVHSCTKKKETVPNYQLWTVTVDPKGQLKWRCV